VDSQCEHVPVDDVDVVVIVVVVVVVVVVRPKSSCH
jgi:hypothetical protein